MQLSSTASGGRINLGLRGIANYSLFFPFINIWKSAGDIHVISDGVTRSSSIGPGTAKSAWDGYLDSNGELMKPLPGNAAQLVRGIYALPPDGFLRVTIASARNGYLSGMARRVMYQ